MTSGRGSREPAECPPPHHHTQGPPSPWLWICRLHSGSAPKAGFYRLDALSSHISHPDLEATGRHLVHPPTPDGPSPLWLVGPARCTLSSQPAQPLPRSS